MIVLFRGVSSDEQSGGGHEGEKTCLWLFFHDDIELFIQIQNKSLAGSYPLIEYPFTGFGELNTQGQQHVAADEQHDAGEERDHEWLDPLVSGEGTHHLNQQHHHAEAQAWECQPRQRFEREEARSAHDSRDLLRIGIVVDRLASEFEPDHQPGELHECQHQVRD